MRLVQQLAQLIAPPVCVLCGGNGQLFDETWGLDLCEHCEAACPPAPPGASPSQATFCLFRYEDPVDQLIVRLKFHHELAHARVLGTLLARALRTRRRPLPECLVPMPLHASRYRERGFCQTTLIARHVAHRLGGVRGAAMPLRPDLLQRTRATRAQSGLDAAARARNLDGAFTCRPRPGHPLPRRVALLDDVLTTGHTARAAIQALHAAGIEGVELWCCARALRRDAHP